MLRLCVARLVPTRREMPLPPHSLHICLWLANAGGRSLRGGTSAKVWAPAMFGLLLACASHWIGALCICRQDCPHLPGTALHRLWRSHLPCGRVATGRELPASGTRRYRASGPLGCRYNPQYDQIIITASSDCNVCPPPTPSAPRAPPPLLSPLARALPSPCPHARHGVVHTAD